MEGGSREGKVPGATFLHGDRVKGHMMAVAVLAAGLQSSRLALRPFTSARPRSAMDMQIVPCQDEAANPWATTTFGSGAGRQGAGDREEDDLLDQHTVSEIFHQMDAVQRDKNESRWV